MTNANSVTKDLKRLGTPKKAKGSSWFFKTEKGQYGYGDIFFGVTVPEQRIVARKYHDLPIQEIDKLLRSKVHECRLTALIILTRQYQKASDKEKAQIAKFYLKRTKFINNWDLVDSSAPYILGGYLFDKDRTILFELARSKDLWERRIAIIATQEFIRREDFADTLKIAKELLEDKHDLIHKAVGWMLREVGNRDKAAEINFLKKFANVMPRTMLRYAIEKFPERQRKIYLSLKLK